MQKPSSYYATLALAIGQGYAGRTALQKGAKSGHRGNIIECGMCSVCAVCARDGGGIVQKLSLQNSRHYDFQITEGLR